MLITSSRRQRINQGMARAARISGRFARRAGVYKNMQKREARMCRLYTRHIRALVFLHFYFGIPARAASISGRLCEACGGLQKEAKTRGANVSAVHSTHSRPRVSPKVSKALGTYQHLDPKGADVLSETVIWWLREAQPKKNLT